MTHDELLKKPQHPQITSEIMTAVMAQLHEDISVYGNDGIVGELEAALADMFNLKKGQVLSTSNGTSALLSMYFGAGIGPGDEVLVPVYTFFATATPLFPLGAIPVLVDCDSSGNIDPEDAKKKITRNTKAIVITHMWGIPGQMDKLMMIAKENNLLLLEDVSHAHGALYGNQVIGSFADGAAWSMQGKKLLTGGEGGFYSSKHSLAFQRAVSYGHFNVRAKQEVTEEGLRDFNVTGLGQNLRISPLHAALALAQTHVFSEQLARRREVAKIFSDGVNSIDGLEQVPIEEKVTPSFYAFGVLFQEDAFQISKADLVAKLNQKGAIAFDSPGSTCPLSQHPLFTRPQDILPQYSDFAKSFSVTQCPKAEVFHKRIVKIDTWYDEFALDRANLYMNILTDVCSGARA